MSVLLIVIAALVVAWIVVLLRRMARLRRDLRYARKVARAYLRYSREVAEIITPDVAVAS